MHVSRPLQDRGHVQRIFLDPQVLHREPDLVLDEEDSHVLPKRVEVEL